MTEALRLGALIATFALATAAGAAPGAEAARADDAPPLDRAHQLVLEAEEHLDRGETAQALPLLRRAEHLAPQWLRPKGLLGVVLQVSGKRAEAVEWYQRMQEGILEGPREQVEFVARCAAELMWLINDERLGRGLRPLKPHPLLALVATIHCQDMRDLGFFSHESPVPGRRTPADRFRAVFGFRPYAVAENIATLKSTGFALSLDNIRGSHRQLMASPGHARNILGKDYTDFGVGIAADKRGAYWISEMFVRFVR